MRIFDDVEGLQRVMRGAPEQCFRPVESCVDYKSFVYTIDSDLSPVRYKALRRQLITLGRADEERMGVVYVRGPWGFFVIPPHGYPILRVSFFHDTSSTEISDVLSSIYEAFEVSDADLNQGDLDE